MRLTAYISAIFAFLPVALTLQECYVCVWWSKSSLELEHQFPEERLPVCHKGILPPPKQCPPRYKGCLTQYSGELVQRSCGELNLTICQPANNIEYCYCEGNLCNGKEPIPKTTTVDPDATSDDEDDVAGSGQGADIEGRVRMESPLKTPKPTVSATPIGNNHLERSGLSTATKTTIGSSAILAALSFYFAI